MVVQLFQSKFAFFLNLTNFLHLETVKIFSDTSLFDLEFSVNAWLNVNQGIEIKNLSQCSFQPTNHEPLHSVTLVYKNCKINKLEPSV